MEGPRAHLLAVVHGHVQRVGFRDFVYGHARRLGLLGYARNLPDGLSVEVRAEGPIPALRDLLALLRTGPSKARVREVDEEWGRATGVFSEFTIRR